MEIEIRNHLWDIREAAKLILDSIAEVTFEEHEDDQMLRSAVERQFEIIGEKITGYKTIISFRNWIIHEYDNIANRTVWDIIQHNLPTLLNEVTDLLEES